MEVDGPDDPGSRLLEFDRSSIRNTDPSLNIELDDRRPDADISSHSSGSPTEVDAPLETARFASHKLLAPWFPQANPEHYRAKTFKAWWSRRKTVLVTANITATTVFLVNMIGTVVLGKLYPDARLFEVDCATASRLNSAIHIIINILSSLLLGASNLCMQLLSAPTREEVDRAHARKKWLDIGIPSIRNLGHIAWQRKAAWIVLALSSLPLHLFFNSAVINMAPQNVYSWAVVTASFLTGAAWNYTTMRAKYESRADVSVWGLDSSSRMTQHPLTAPVDFDLFIEHGVQDAARLQHNITTSISSYQNLNAFDCLKRYTSFGRDVSDVILISSYDMVENSSDFLTRENSLLWRGDQINTWVWVTPHRSMWECGTSNSFNCFRPQSWGSNENLTADWNVGGYKIDYCLARSQSLGDKCSLRLISTIMLVVCIANATKCLCIGYTLRLHWRKDADKTPLSTLGDVALSFLTRRDTRTERMSMADRANIDRIWRDADKRTETPWTPRRDRWYAVSSKWTFLSTVLICTSVLVVVLALFVAGMINTASVMGSRIPHITSLGFGQPSQFETSIGGGLGMFLGHSIRALYVSIMWANMWQLILSILYVQYNAQVTAFLVGVEWSNFACGYPSKDKGMRQTDTTANRTKSQISAMPFPMRVWNECRRLTARQTHKEPPVRVRKTLRVSEPVGLQRSSYFVSMPLRYGIPLIATMSALHWLVSQSIFVVAAVPYGADGQPGLASYTSANSLEAIIIAICVSFVLIVALIVLGMRRYPGTIPLASSCSAAISAACHLPPGDNEAYLFPVQ